MTYAKPIRDYLATQDGGRTAGEIGAATGIASKQLSGAVEAWEDGWRCEDERRSRK